MPRMNICSYCGTMHTVTERCACRVKAHKQRNAEKNQLSDDFYTKKKWRKFRKRILKRDQGVCLRCLIKYNVVTTESLEAHHIKSRLNYPELSFDESNVMTLCKSCNTQLGTADKLDFKYEVPKDDWMPVL
ncbi:MAG: HNH endonuclease [Bacillus sp. (in: firmicutes)]